MVGRDGQSSLANALEGIGQRHARPHRLAASACRARRARRSSPASPSAPRRAQPVEERDRQFHLDRADVPAAGDDAAIGRTRRRLAVDMKRLRIVLRAERDDLLLGEGVASRPSPCRPAGCPRTTCGHDRRGRSSSVHTSIITRSSPCRASCPARAQEAAVGFGLARPRVRAPRLASASGRPAAPACASAVPRRRANPGSSVLDRKSSTIMRMASAPRCQPLAASPPSSRLFRRFRIGVLRLRIEFAREFDDLVRRERMPAAVVICPAREIFESAEPRSSTARSDVNRKCITSPSCTT